MNHFHGLRVLRVANGFPNGNIRNSRYHHDISAVRLWHRRALQSSVYENLIYLAGDDAAVCLCHRNGLPLFNGSLGDSADPQPADVVVIGKGGNLKLQRLLVQVGVRLAMLDDRVKQRRKVKPSVARRTLFNLGIAFSHQHAQGFLRVFDCDSLTGDSVKDWEVKLVVVCFQIHEKLVNLVHHLVDSGVLFVQLVYEQNRVNALFQ